MVTDFRYHVGKPKNWKPRDKCIHGQSCRAKCALMQVQYAFAMCLNLILH